MAKRKRRNSIWKNGKEYFWSPKRGRYERWITIGKRRICDAYNGGIQIPRDITSREQEYLLQLAVDSDDEELYFNIRNLFSRNKEEDYPNAFSLYQKPIFGVPRVATSNEFVKQIDLKRIEKYKDQRAKTRSDRTQRHANLRNEVMVLKRNEHELELQIELYESLDQEHSRDLGVTDIKNLRNLLSRTQARLHAIAEETKTEKFARINDRDSVGERLRILLPNRGGKELLNEDCQKRIKNLFAKHNRKNIAIQIIEVYNAIGRCYNLRRREFIQPTVVFGHLEPEKEEGSIIEVLGRFKNNVITLNEKLLGMSPQWVLTVFAHELGHWLESTVCKTGYYNQRWLQGKQGDFIQKGKKKIAPFDKFPTLCADDYAQIVRDDGTELISVAMQELVADPEIFARRCPEHFDLLLDNFKEI